MSALPRDKKNIMEHTIIYPDGSCISLPSTTDTKAEGPTTMDFDINNMPIVFEGVVIVDNVNTLPAPAVGQSCTTNAPAVPNIVPRAAKPLKLVTGKSYLNPNKTALKTYSRKSKDAKLSVNTGKTYSNLRSSRYSLSNKHTVVPTGSNTLLPNSSTSVIPAISACSRLSYETSSEPALGRLVLVTSTNKDRHSGVQLNTRHGRAIYSHSTLFNTKNKQANTLQQKNPIIKTTSTRKVSGKTCSLPSVVNLPAVPGISPKPHTVINTSKGAILPAPPHVFSKVNKVSLIITKPHGTVVTSRSEGILPLPRVSSEPLSLLSTTKAAFDSPIHAAPKTLNLLSMEGSVSSTVHIQNKFESLTSAKQVKLEEGNIVIPSRNIIIKGAQGEIVKKLNGVEKLTGVEDPVLKKQVPEQLRANKASGSSVELKSKQKALAKSKLSQNKMVNKKMSSREKTIAKSLALYKERYAKLLKANTYGLTLNMSPGANSHSTQSRYPKRAPANSSIKQFVNKTESVLSHREKGVILCNSFDNHTSIDEGQLVTVPKRASDGAFELLTVDGIDLIPSNDEIPHFIDPTLVSNINVSNCVPAQLATQAICDLSSYNSASNQVNYNHSLFTEQASDVLFPYHPIRSQDILTTALTDTDFLQDTSIPSIDFNLPPLSPNGVLDSISVVSALKSSVMATHELSSTNTKIISDAETNILSTDVSEYVPLPITSTHLKIVQSASQPHLLDASAPGMPFSETEPGDILFSSTQVSSPSSVSLPILDEDTTQQQTYSSIPISMPSLNEDCSMSEIRKINDDCNSSTKYTLKTKDTDFSPIFNSSNHIDFGHLSPVGAEPPSDMFDLNMFDRYPMYPSVIELETNIVGSSSITSSDDTIYTVNSHHTKVNEDSCEIPVKPDIVTDLSSPYITNSPFLTAYSSDQPMDFSKRYNEDESSDESRRKKHRYF